MNDVLCLLCVISHLSCITCVTLEFLHYRLFRMHVLCIFRLIWLYASELKTCIVWFIVGNLQLFRLNAPTQNHGPHCSPQTESLRTATARSARQLHETDARHWAVIIYTQRRHTVEHYVRRLVRHNEILNSVVSSCRHHLATRSTTFKLFHWTLPVELSLTSLNIAQMISGNASSGQLHS